MSSMVQSLYCYYSTLEIIIFMNRQDTMPLARHTKGDDVIRSMVIFCALVVQLFFSAFSAPLGLKKSNLFTSQYVPLSWPLYSRSRLDPQGGFLQSTMLGHIIIHNNL